MSPPRPQRRLRAVALLSRRLLVVVVGLWALWGIAVPSWAAPDPADEGVAVESAEEPGCLGDCPEDAEDGECQSGCTACSCCPASAAPAAGTDGRLAASSRGPAATRSILDSAKTEDGALSRVFRPPRSAIS